MGQLENYHTHTCRCGHAKGDVDEYAAEAVRQGGSVLGFTDHVPFPDGRWQRVRMTMEELAGYEAAISAARREFPSLRLFTGAECEHGTEFLPYFQEELLARRGYDYLIAGNHWFLFRGEWESAFSMERPAQLHAYADSVVAAIASQAYLFIAHPDCFGVSWLEWDAEAMACSRAIFQAAAEYRVPLEINGYGLRKPMIDTPSGKRRLYPLRPFWELASEYEVEVVANSDAHRPEDVYASIEEAYALGDAFGLKHSDMRFRLEDEYTKKGTR